MPWPGVFALIEEEVAFLSYLNEVVMGGLEAKGGKCLDLDVVARCR